MKGPWRLAVTLALLTLSVLGNCGGAPQRLFERRNWTPQAMLYLKGAQGPCFILDQNLRKHLTDRMPPGSEIFSNRTKQLGDLNITHVTSHQIIYVSHRLLVQVVVESEERKAIHCLMKE